MFGLLAAFLLITLLIGIIAYRKEDTEGFLIANRKLGTFQSVMTICASFVGAMSLMDLYRLSDRFCFFFFLCF